MSVLRKQMLLITLEKVVLRSTDCLSSRSCGAYPGLAGIVVHIWHHESFGLYKIADKNGLSCTRQQ